MMAWHFTDDTLRDGQPVPKVRVTLCHDGPLSLCESGLHASPRLIDALRYAPGETLHRVALSGHMLHGNDKSVATERTILWTLPETVMEPLLRAFARRCALDVIDLWDAPDIVRTYLETGREELRIAAGDATWDTTRDAAAQAAARDAARDAAWDAAWAAAREAAWEAARAAAWAAAWDTTQAAAWDAAWDSAREAAWTRQNRRLTSMVMAAQRARTEQADS